MVGLGVSSRRRVRTAIEWLPYGRDLFLVAAGPRLGIAYRGMFDSAQSARQDIPEDAAAHYDRVNELRQANEEEEVAALGQTFAETDYPLLFWLSRLYQPGLRVLELGGSLGHLFYALADRAPLPDDAKWTIAELPEAAKFGREIAGRRGESRLSFIDSDRIDEAPQCDVFLTAGTIQYMEKSLPEILASLETLPSHVLVHNTPMHADRQWWTRQNLGIVEVPYRIYSRSGLVDDMARLGYRETAAWGHDRPVPIPFHLDLEVEGYLGLQFELCADTEPEADATTGGTA